MPVYILIVFLLTGMLAGCAPYAGYPDDDWWAADKAAHFAASGIIGVNSSVIAHQEGASPSEAFGVGMAVALVAGVAKECFDLYIRRSYWSWKDMFWNLAGAVTGSIVGVKLISGHQMTGLKTEAGSSLLE